MSQSPFSAPDPELIEENIQFRELLRTQTRMCSLPWHTLREAPQGTNACCWTQAIHSGPIDSAEAAQAVWQSQAPATFRHLLATQQSHRVCRPHCPVMEEWDDMFGEIQFYAYTREELATYPIPFLANRRNVMMAVLKGDAQRLNHPLRLKVGPSTLCNLRCNMCYLDLDHPWKKDWYHGDAWEAMKPFLEELTVFEGEPMVCDTSRRLLLDEPLPPHTHLSFLTNGTLLTDEAYDKLQARRIGSINLSLDAISPETYARIRHRGVHATTFANVQRYARLSQNHPIRNFQVYLNFLIQDANHHEMADFVAFCCDEGLLPNFTLLTYLPDIAHTRAQHHGIQVGQDPFHNEASLARSFEAALRMAEARGADRILRHLKAQLCE